MNVKHSLRVRQASIYWDEFYVVPGGRLDARDALKILGSPDVRSFDDGLFPGHSHSGGYSETGRHDKRS